MNNIIQGIVVKGKELGRTLGFPTANIQSNIQLSTSNIQHGVYASVIEIDGQFYNSATSIGKNETFDENEVSIETYIFNFNKDIYGKKISLNLIAKIRDMKKFSSKDELIKEMREDIKKAKAILYQLKLNFR